MNVMSITEEASSEFNDGSSDQDASASADPFLTLPPTKDLCYDCGRTYKTWARYKDGVDYSCLEREEEVGVHLPPIAKLSKPKTIVSQLYEARCRLFRLKFLVEERKNLVERCIADYEEVAPCLPRILEQTLFIEEGFERMKKERGREPTEREEKVVAEARSIKDYADNVREFITADSKLPYVKDLLDLLEEAHEMARCLREGDMTTQDVSRYFNDYFLPLYNHLLPRMNEVRRTHDNLWHIELLFDNEHIKRIEMETAEVAFDVQCRSLSYERWDQFLQRHADGSSCDGFDIEWEGVEGEEDWDDGLLYF